MRVRKLQQHRSLALVVEVALAFSLVLNAVRELGLPLNSLDEALNVVLAEKVLHGAVAGRDFFTLYGHGAYVATASAFGVLGESVATQRLVGLGYHLAIVMGVVRLTRPFGRLQSVGAGFLSFSLLAWIGTAAFPWFGGLALSIWSLALVARATRADGDAQSTRSLAIIALAGALAMLSGMWRVEMPALAVSALPMLWWGRRLAAFAVGAFVGLLPTTWWALTAGPAVLADILLMRTRVDFQARLSDNPSLTWALLGWSVLGLVLMICVVVRRRRRFEVSLGAFCILLVPQMIQRLELAHVIFSAAVIIPVTSLCAWSWVAERDMLTAGSTPRSAVTGAGIGTRIRGVLGLSLLVVSLARVPGLVVGSSAEPSVVFSGSRSLPVGRDEAGTLSGVLDAVRAVAPAGSRLFVGSQDMSRPTLTDMRLYFLMPEYRQDGYYLYLPPGVAEAAGSGLARDIARADVLALNYFDDKSRAAVFPRIPSGSQDANDVVRMSFKKVRSVGTFDIYVRRDAPALANR